MKLDFGIRDSVNFSFSLGGSPPPPAPIMPIVELTQSQYDALSPPDPDTLYGIPEEVS